MVPGADYRNNNLGQVTMADTLPIEAIAIVGDSYVINSGKYMAKLFPTFTSQRGISWSISSGGEYAEVDSDGNVTAKVGASGNTAVLRCESTDNPEIFAEKTLVMTAGEVVFYDYLQSDGNAYILHPGTNALWGFKMVVRGTLSGNNGYIMGCRYASNSTQARVAAYQNGQGYAAALVGTAGFTSLGFKKTDTSTIYRWEFFGSQDSSHSDGYCRCYEDATDILKGSVTKATMTASGYISIFTLGYGSYYAGTPFTDSAGNHGAVKFYGLTLEDEQGNLLIDLRPCTMDGTPCLLDIVGGGFYYNETGSGLTAGND